ncbi:MAG: glycosyltransferase [Candidatus Neomarinimicrobiota bacterium]
MNMHAQKMLPSQQTGNNEAAYVARLNRVQRFIDQNDYENALELLDGIYASNRYDLHLNILIAEIHLSIRQYREACRFFARANGIDPGNTQALYGLGKASYLQGDSRKAVGYLKATLKDEVYRADVYNDLGTISEELGNPAEAELYFNQAIDCNPNFVAPIINLSGLLVCNQRHADALSWIDLYLESNPPDERLLINKGVIQEDLGQYEAAIDTFAAILKQNPGNTDALFDRAYCYLKLSQIEAARADLEAYLAIKPDAEQVKGLLALSFTLEGKFQDSIDTWKEFLPLFQDLKPKAPKANSPRKIQPVRILENININGKNNGGQTLELSVVVPVLNEEGSLRILYEQLKKTLGNLERSYELILVDDGSDDNSWKIMSDIADHDPTVSVIKFRKNYGQTAAFAAGFKYAQGEVVITMDADLQNDPADIPRLLEKMADGYDLVSGWRKDRQDKALSRKVPSFFANRIINKLIAGTQVKIHDFGCSLKAYKKGVVKNIKIYGEMHRFIPAYAAWLGIRVAEIPVNHRPRRYGKAKYGLERVGRVILDLITLRFFTGFKTRPLQFFGKIALFVTAVGMILSALLLTLGFISEWGVDFQTFILIIMFSIMGGFQFIIVGLLSEIMMRGFMEAQDRDDYVVETIYNQEALPAQ